MLKLPRHSSFAAIALCLAVPVQAQGAGGLGGQLDAAEQKLAQDSQSCTPINLGEYQALLNEAAKNKKRAEKAKKAGAPVDEAQVNADLAKASALFNRAVAAHVQQCVRQATSQAPQPPDQAMNLSPFAQEILALHNSTRAEFRAPPVKWDHGLAFRAGEWAGQMAGSGQLVHSPREERGTERENLAQAPLGYSAAEVVGRWIAEKNDFVSGVFPNVCRSGGVCEGVLHISQMIWPTTVAIGCGKAVGKGSQWVVCRYGPGGNKDGKWVGIPRTEILADLDTKVEQPTLPGTEVFHKDATSAKPAVSPDSGHAVSQQFEPANAIQCAYKAGGDLKKAFGNNDLDAFADAKARMAAAIAQQRQRIEAAYELGEMADKGSLEGLVYWLNWSTKWYEVWTGDKAPTGPAPADGECQADSAVAQPQLPPKEVFKPDPPAKLDDPM